MINFTIRPYASTTANAEDVSVVSTTTTRFISAFVHSTAEVKLVKERIPQQKSSEELEWEEYKKLEPRIWNVSKMLSE